MKKSLLKVGAWAGSSPGSTEDLEHGLAYLRSQNVDVVILPQTLKFATVKESEARPYLAGPDQEKVKAFAKLWNSTDLRHIIGTRGGYGCLRLLASLDKIKLQTKTPKHFWGFSDSTVLQNYLFARTGSLWVHGPHINSASLHAMNAAEIAAWDIQRTQVESSYEISQVSALSFAGPKLSAVIIGGNLTSFISLLGTPWEPRPKTNFILFLEDLNEAPYRIDRMLTQLSHCALMKKCVAVVLGHFTNCGDARAVFETWSKEFKVPVFDGILSGHDRPHLPLTLGVKATIVKKSKKRGTLILPNLKFGC